MVEAASLWRVRPWGNGGGAGEHQDVPGAVLSSLSIISISFLTAEHPLVPEATGNLWPLVAFKFPVQPPGEIDSR